MLSYLNISVLTNLIGFFVFQGINSKRSLQYAQKPLKKFVVKTSNRFGCLGMDEVMESLFEDSSCNKHPTLHSNVTSKGGLSDDRQVHSDDQFKKVSVTKKKTKKLYNKKRRIEFKYHEKLNKFETHNRFHLFEDIDDESVEGIKLKSDIKITPKKSLKRCKYCNKKKRSCSLNPLSCVSLNNFCYKCGKAGHYPKSMRCKASKKSEHNGKESKRREHKKSYGIYYQTIDCVVLKQTVSYVI